MDNSKNCSFDLVDLVLINGKFITLDGQNSSSQAAAVMGGRFVAVGTNEDIQPYINMSKQVIDLKGNSVVPGFNDAHCHPTNYHPEKLDLKDLSSIEDLQERIATRLKEIPDSDWLVGDGWIESSLLEKRMLTRWDLDPVSTDHPVVLFRWGYHQLVANSKALQLCGIGADTRLKVNGHIERRNTDDQLTGMFWEPGAMDLVWDHIPVPPTAQRARELGDELNRLTGLGLTSLTSSKLRTSEMRAYQYLYSTEDTILPRLLMEPWLHWRGSLTDSLSFITDQAVRSDFGNHKLRLGALKLFVDGDETAGTALMYDDVINKHYKGMLMMAPEDLNTVVLKAHCEGWRVAIHVIGDAAIDLALDAIEGAVTKEPGTDMRHTLIHVSFPSERAIHRMAELGIIANIQPNLIWFGDDENDLFGEEKAKSYIPLRSMLDAGIRIAFSSDNLPFGPLLGIANAASRMTKSGPMNLNESITVEEALSCYTWGSALTSFEEKVKGVIHPGYLADMVVLSADPFKVSPELISDIKVLATIIDGKIVYCPDPTCLKINN